MRLRPVLALSALLVLLPSFGHALGLGEIQLKSGLNQPMQAQIELLQVRDLNPNEIIPSLAGPKDFERAGVSREFFLTDMRFEVRTLDDGRLVVSIQTQRPVREPFMNFLVEVIWPGGRLLREYTLLIDPPVYADRVADRPTPSVSLTNAEPKAAAPQKVQRGGNASFVSESELPPIDEITPSQSTRFQSSGKPATQSLPSSASAQNVKPDAKPVVKSGSSASQKSDMAASTNGSETYTTVKNDALWNIATMTRPSPEVSVQQTMLAIQAKNPDAFINGNINQMKRGQVLRMPTQSEIKSLSRKEAVAEVARQERDWRQRLASRKGAGSQAVAKATITDAKAARVKMPEEEGSGRLSLSSGGKTAGKGAEVSAVGGEGTSTEGTLATAELQNEMDRIKRERSDAKSRLTELEGLLADNERLISLQNQQIAKLRERLAEIERQAKQAGTDAATQAQSGVEAGLGEEPAYGMPTEFDGETGMLAGEGDSQGTQTQEMPSGFINPENTMGAAEVPPTVDSTVASQAPSVSEAMPRQQLPEAKPFYQNPIYIGIAVGGVIVAGILLFVMRRGGDHDELDDELSEEDLELEHGLDGSLKLDGEVALDEISDDEARDVGAGYALDDQIGEQSEILEDADLQMAYGFYAEAQKKLKTAIAHDPSCTEYYWKLLEVFVETHDAEGFIACEAALGKVNPSALNEDKITQLRTNFGDDLPPPTPSAAARFGNESGGAAAVVADARQAEDDGLSSLQSLEALESGLTTNLGGDTGLGSMGKTQSRDFDDPITENSTDLADELSLGADLDLSALEEDLSLDLGATDVLAETDLDSSDQVDLQEPSLDLDDFNVSESSEQEQTEDFDPAALMAELDDVFEPTAQSSGDLDSPIIGGAPIVDGAQEQGASDDYLGNLSEDLDLSLDSGDAGMGGAAEMADSMPSLDDEDLMSGDDMSIKLDLARAYIDMGDKVGARDILDEVVSEGTSEQKQEASDLLKRVS